MYDPNVLNYLGDISQLAAVRRYESLSGKSKGVEIFDVTNGSGLHFTVVADRCMDIHQLTFKGIPISFISKVGLTSPMYFDSRADNWLRSFPGGFLTTCGLSQVGEPCEHNGRQYGLHGLVSNIPADQVSYRTYWDNDIYRIELEGEMRQSMVQHEDISLKRKIKTSMGDNTIILMDTIVNNGVEDQPLMLLYHFNFGYPLLSPKSRLEIHSQQVSGWDEYSHSVLDSCLEIHHPSTFVREETFLHRPVLDSNGNAQFLLSNPNDGNGIGILIKYNAEELPFLAQWKYFKNKEYVMALEPCNNCVKGIKYESEHGKLRIIHPGESVSIKFNIELFDDKKAE